MRPLFLHPVDSTELLRYLKRWARAAKAPEFDNFKNCCIILIVRKILIRPPQGDRKHRVHPASSAHSGEKARQITRR